MLTISYFAWVREAMGCHEEQLTLPPSVTAVADLIDWLEARNDAGARAFADRSHIRAAINGDMVPLDCPIGTASDIALFPPVTGG